MAQQFISNQGDGFSWKRDEIKRLLAEWAATGKVTFYDGAGVLGTIPVSGGQAALKTIVPSAPHEAP